MNSSRGSIIPQSQLLFIPPRFHFPTQNNTKYLFQRSIGFLATISFVLVTMFLCSSVESTCQHPFALVSLSSVLSPMISFSTPLSFPLTPLHLNGKNQSTSSLLFHLSGRLLTFGGCKYHLSSVPFLYIGQMVSAASCSSPYKIKAICFLLLLPRRRTARKGKEAPLKKLQN